MGSSDCCAEELDEALEVVFVSLLGGILLRSRTHSFDDPGGADEDLDDQIDHAIVMDEHAAFLWRRVRYDLILL